MKINKVLFVLCQLIVFVLTINLTLVFQETAYASTVIVENSTTYTDQLEVTEHCKERDTKPGEDRTYDVSMDLTIDYTLKRLDDNEKNPFIDGDNEACNYWVSFSGSITVTNISNTTATIVPYIYPLYSKSAIDSAGPIDHNIESDIYNIDKIHDIIYAGKELTPIEGKPYYYSKGDGKCLNTSGFWYINLDEKATINAKGGGYGGPLRGAECEMFGDPIGWAISFDYGSRDVYVLGSDNSKKVSFMYTPDAFEAYGKKIDITFNADDITSGNIAENKNLLSIAALECAVTYKNEAEVIALLEDLGYKDIKSYPGDESDRFIDNCTFWLGHQTRSDGVEVVSVLIKGTDGAQQWASELLNLWNPTSSTAEHFGFENAASDAMSEVGDYITDCGIDRSNMVLYIRGHSRGAGAGNVLAKNETSIHGKEKVKAILFATPNVYWDKSGDGTLENIVNIEDGGDIVTKLPPGGSKNGIILGYNSDRDIIKQYYSVGSLMKGSFGAEDIFWTHTPENYLARVMSYLPRTEWNSSSWQLIGIHCETNIKVMDANGNIVASIEDNIVNSRNMYPIYTNDDEEKTIILPENVMFIIEVTARADTRVEYSINTLTSNGEIIEYIKPDVIDFAGGDVREVLLYNDPEEASELKLIATSSTEISQEAQSTIVASLDRVETLAIAIAVVLALISICVGVIIWLVNRRKKN